MKIRLGAMMSTSRLMNMAWGVRTKGGAWQDAPRTQVDREQLRGRDAKDNEPSGLSEVLLLVLLSMEGCDIEAEIVGVERFLWYPGDDDEMFGSVCENDSRALAWISRHTLGQKPMGCRDRCPKGNKIGGLYHAHENRVSYELQYRGSQM